VQALQVLGGDLPRLFEARLVALSTNVLRFVGFERIEESCWVMQEWECELLYDRGLVMSCRFGGLTSLLFIDLCFAKAAWSGSHRDGCT
jgi:hypothetical protein